jgi:tetratricopeptide (TPR) repeat protein
MYKTNKNNLNHGILNDLSKLIIALKVRLFLVIFFTFFVSINSYSEPTKEYYFSKSEDEISKNRDISAGIDFLNKAIEIDNEYSEAYLMRSMFYMIQDMNAKALQDLYTLERFENPSNKTILAIGALKYLLVNEEEGCNDIEYAFTQLGKGYSTNTCKEIASTYYMLKGGYEALVYKYSKAIKSLTKAIELTPDNIELYLMRGAIFVDLDTEKALKDFDKCLEIDSSYIDAIIEKYYVYAELDSNNKAIRLLNRIIDIDGDYELAYYERSRIKLNLQDYEGALEDSNISLKLNPERLGAYLNRGFAKSGLDDNEGSIEDYKRIIDIDSSYENAYFNMAISQEELGEYKDAIKSYDTYIEIVPNDDEAYNRRGWMKVELGEYDAAIEDFNKAINLNPDEALHFNSRCCARIKIDDLEDAKKDCYKALDIDYYFHYPHFNLGDIHFLNKNYEDAINEFTIAIEIDNEYGEAYFGRAKASDALKDYDGACVDMKKAYELGIRDEQMIDYIKKYCK